MDNTLGIGTWGSGNRKTRGKLGKEDLIKKICSVSDVKTLDISVLSLKDLKTILKELPNIPKQEHKIPDSRFKLPFIEVLTPYFPEVALSKLSVSSLKELIGAVNNVKQ